MGTKTRGKALYHLATGFFFALLLAGALGMLSLTLRQYWSEILAALEGEMPRRRTARPWTRAIRVMVRPLPAPARLCAAV